jgi:hypothetical protein
MVRSRKSQQSTSLRATVSGLTKDLNRGLCVFYCLPFRKFGPAGTDKVLAVFC